MGFCALEGGTKSGGESDRLKDDVSAFISENLQKLLVSINTQCILHISWTPLYNMEYAVWTNCNGMMKRPEIIMPNQRTYELIPNGTEPILMFCVLKTSVV